MARQTILIVDDESLNISTLSTGLRGEYKLLAAKSGAQALERLEKNVVDLVLLDIMMPGMDGYEVLRRIKNSERSKEIPVIFITAKNADEDEARGLQMGAVDYIKKPFYLPIVKVRVATHLDLRLKNIMLTELASLDGLTNIFNRRKFDQQLDIEWKRCHRDHIPLSLLMLDVDFFKAFNDNYGHASGDACLRRLAEILGKCANRPGDFLARYGGEEFVIILPNTWGEGVHAVASEIIEMVRAEKIEHEYSVAAPYVTASLGGAVAMPNKGHCTALELLRTADNMLYKAKDQGRDRFMIHEVDTCSE